MAYHIRKYPRQPIGSNDETSSFRGEAFEIHTDVDVVALKCGDDRGAATGEVEYGMGPEPPQYVFCFV